MPADPDWVEARQIAADMFYCGVKAAVMAGAYDKVGDIVKIAFTAIKRGREMEKRGAPIAAPKFVCPVEGEPDHDFLTCFH